MFANCFMKIPERARISCLTHLNTAESMIETIYGEQYGLKERTLLFSFLPLF